MSDLVPWERQRTLRRGSAAQSGGKRDPPAARSGPGRFGGAGCRRPRRQVREHEVMAGGGCDRRADGSSATTKVGLLLASDVETRPVRIRRCCRRGALASPLGASHRSGAAFVLFQRRAPPLEGARGKGEVGPTGGEAASSRRREWMNAPFRRWPSVRARSRAGTSFSMIVRCGEQGGAAQNAPRGWSAPIWSSAWSNWDAHPPRAPRRRTLFAR